MADVPELVTNWRRVAWTVISSVRENADTVAPKIQRDNYPEDPQGTQVKTEYLARADSLERKLIRLERSALAVLGERGDNPGLTAAQDEAVEILRDHIIRTRLFVEATYDAAILPELGLTGDTPRDPSELLTYARNASTRLREHELPETSGDGVSFDPARRAALIDAGVARLEAATTARALDNRQDESALRARNEAEEDLRHSYIALADLFAADAVTAGHPEIADRVRPTHRRREGIPEPTDVEDGTDQPDPTLVTDGPIPES